MPASSAQTSLLDQARFYFAERLVKEFQPWLDAAMAGAQARLMRTRASCRDALDPGVRRDDGGFS